MSNAELMLVAGSSNPFELLFLDANGVKESFAGSSDGTMVIKESSNGAVILKRTKAAANLTVDSTNSKFVCTLTQNEADALVPGVYIGEAAIAFGSQWFHTLTFIVRIVKGLTPHS